MVQIFVFKSVFLKCNVWTIINLENFNAWLVLPQINCFCTVKNYSNASSHGCELKSTTHMKYFFSFSLWEDRFIRERHVFKQKFGSKILLSEKLPFETKDVSSKNVSILAVVSFLIFWIFVPKWTSNFFH